MGFQEPVEILLKTGRLNFFENLEIILADQPPMQRNLYVILVHFTTILLVLSASERHVSFAA